MSSISSVSQELDVDAIVTMFRLDVSSLGGPVLNFVQAREENDPVVFDGVTYQPHDVEFEGMTVSGVGDLPTPTIRVSNTNGIFQALVNTYGDMLGCPLIRIRTYRRFLDGQPGADPLAFMGPDIFEVDRKAHEDDIYLEWELSTSIDQEGKMLPGRQVIRDTCLWRYRVWNADTEEFVYTKAQCPYTGAQSYDINDQPVADGAEDVPSRRLSCCKTRFGADAVLPFGGFPGASRVRA